MPQFSGETWTADARVFTEQGEEIQSFSVTSSLHSLERADFTLSLIPNFGTVEWTFRDGVVGHLSVLMDALGRFSVGFEAECRDQFSASLPPGSIAFLKRTPHLVLAPCPCRSRVAR